MRVKLLKVSVKYYRDLASQTLAFDVVKPHYSSLFTSIITHFEGYQRLEMYLMIFSLCRMREHTIRHANYVWNCIAQFCFWLSGQVETNCDRKSHIIQLSLFSVVYTGYFPLDIVKSRKNERQGSKLIIYSKLRQHIINNNINIFTVPEQFNPEICCIASTVQNSDP